VRGEERLRNFLATPTPAVHAGLGGLPRPPRCLPRADSAHAIRPAETLCPAIAQIAVTAYNLAMRFCTHCGHEIHPAAIASAVYCSTRCRVAHHRSLKDPVPLELRSLDRWVRYLAKSKIPLQTRGAYAKSNDPTTWNTYAACRESTRGQGVGFVLNGDGIICVDLDHCIQADGHLTAMAAFLLGATPATYIETSPSGTGLHVWGKGYLPRAIVGKTAEAYSTGRYITLTGKRFNGSPSKLADLGAVLSLISRIS
jgi:hypothetical protein